MRHHHSEGALAGYGVARRNVVALKSIRMWPREVAGSKAIITPASILSSDAPRRLFIPAIAIAWMGMTAYIMPTPLGRRLPPGICRRGAPSHY